MTLINTILSKLRVLKYFSIIAVLVCSLPSQAQVLEPLGAGLPSRVVAAYASGNEYLALFSNTFACNKLFQS